MSERDSERSEPVRMSESELDDARPRDMEDGADAGGGAERNGVAGGAGPEGAPMADNSEMRLVQQTAQSQPGAGQVPELELQDWTTVEKPANESANNLNEFGASQYASVKAPTTCCQVVEVDERTLAQVAVSAAAGGLLSPRLMKSAGLTKSTGAGLDEAVSRIKLTRHIENHHPTKTVTDEETGQLKQVRYGVCEELGILPICKCCVKDTSSMAKQIGVGPALFLMSTKALSWFFLFLTILNIPVMLFYGLGNSHGNDASSLASNAFTVLSLGNVGQSSAACGETNYARIYKAETEYYQGKAAKPQTAASAAQQSRGLTDLGLYSNVSLSCGYGTASKLGPIAYFGLAKNDTANCKAAFDAPDKPTSYFDSTCFVDAADKDKTKDTWASVEESARPWPPGTAATTRRNLETTTAAGEKTPKGPSGLYDEQALTVCYNDLVKRNFKLSQERIRDNEKQLDPTKGLPRGWFELYYACNCLGKASCDVPVNFLNLADGTEDVFKTQRGTGASPFSSSLWTYTPACGKKLNQGIKRSGNSDYGKGSAGAASYDENVPEPRLMLVTDCVMNDIINPFSGEPLQKAEMADVIVWIDMVVVVSFLIFIWIMEDSQEAYAHQFKEESIEMNDFSIRVKGMPLDHQYGNDENNLRAFLTHHLEGVIQDEMAAKGKKHSGCNDDNADFDNIGADGPALKSFDWEVADINFGKTNMGYVDYLNKLADLRVKFIANKHRLTKTEDMKLQGTIANEQEALQRQWSTVLDSYKEALRQTEEAAELEDNKDASVRFAYVVFRSMHAMEHVLDAYKIGTCKRWCIMSCGCCCKAKQAALKKKYFFRRWPTVGVACEPDNIKWFNLGTTAKSRRARIGIIWIIAIALIFASMIGIVIMKQETEQLKKQFNSDVICPGADDITKEKAWKDQIRPAKQRLGLMACYCKAEAKKLKLKVLDISFTKFTDPATGKPDTIRYCKDWAMNFAIQQSMVVGTSLVVVIINIITCTIFERIVFIEKRHTINDETQGQFTKITLMQFTNIAVVILVINFGFLDGDFLGFLPIFNGSYTDFSADWYGNVGKTLCLTLLINIFSPHASKLLLPLVKLLRRCCDRGCKLKLQEDEDDDAALHTKHVMQEDLNALYTGDQISSHYVYAQNFTYLWCVLMYSTGMPILYPFGCIFYAVLYWVYKFLLLKYYERTTRFNEELPIYTTGYIKIGLVLHGIFGGFMITNSQLIPPGAKVDRTLVLNATPSAAFGSTDDLLVGLEARFFASSFGTTYFFFWVCVIVWLIARPTILELVAALFGCLGKLCEKTEELSGAHSEDVFKELAFAPLADYYDKASDELRVVAAEDAQRFDPAESDQYRYPEEVEFTRDSYVKKLARRSGQIELVIDDHLDFLHGAHQMRLFTAKRLTYEEKLAYLFKQQLYFDCQDPSHQTRKDTLRVRMQTITQSYNMLDSALYAKMKAVAELLEDTDNSFQLGGDERAAAKVNIN